MKLGIFGDSYAESSVSSKFYDGWSKLLEKELPNCEVINHAKAGTSVWWSFKEFLVHWHQYDTIIFCHSVMQRYPALPENDENVYLHGDITGHHPSMKELSKYYLDILPIDLLRFICRNVAFEIDNICHTNNRKLLQIFTEMDPAIKPNDIMKCSRIFSFWYPDRNEYININGDNQLMHNVLFGNAYGKRKSPDFRSCHFNSLNNQLVASHVKEILLSDQKIDKNFEDYVWHKNDPLIDQMYQELMDNNKL